jgi:hypothetical protein
MYQRCSQWTDFCKILYWRLLWKFVHKIQIWIKSTTISGTLYGNLNVFHNFGSDMCRAPTNTTHCCFPRQRFNYLLHCWQGQLYVDNKSEGSIVFPWQKWLRGSATVLSYTHVAHMLLHLCGFLFGDLHYILSTEFIRSNIISYSFESPIEVVVQKCVSLKTARY